MLLEAKQIFKSYHDTSEKLDILKGLDLVVQKGEKIAITGQSGSGKSTLLHVTGLLDKHDSGFIKYFGKEMTANDKRIHQFRNEKIGFVFQFHYLLQDFTAEENVSIPMLIKTNNIAKSRKKARDLLALFHLKERKDHYPNALSGGEQQRVAMARALINKPDILFADEPTGNLDEMHSSEIIDLLVQWNQEYGQTILLVTHNQVIAKQMDKHFHLENGILHQIK